MGKFVTSQEKLERMLLSGDRVNKFLFYERTGTVCLAQRILDIKQDKGWFIRSRTIKGKGTLREYWLDKDEISRIKGEKPKDEQSPIKKETSPKTAENETETKPKRTEFEPPKAEQGRLGLFGEGEWYYR